MKKYYFFLLLYGLSFPVGAQVCQTVGNIIRQVSVNDSGQPVLTWDTPDNLPANATGYIIYDYIGGTNCTEEITRVGLSTFSFTHDDAAPLTGPRAYSIAVNTTIEPEPITRQHAFSYLQASYDSCTYAVNMQWTPYVGWGDNVFYEIYGGVQGAAPALLAENIAASQYEVAGVPDDVLFEVYVAAVNGVGERSLSNRVALRTKTARRPQFLAITSLAFANNTVDLTLAIDPAAQLPTYHLLRSREPGEGFTRIYTFSDKALTAYTDTDVATEYYYRLTAENYCRLEAAAGAVVNNLVLQGAHVDNAWQLSWPALAGDAPQYVLTRTQPTPETVLYGGAATSYADAIDTESSGLDYCYKVAAASVDGKHSVTEQCFSYVPAVIMPDAIDPQSSLANPQTGRQRNQFGPIIYAHPASYAYQLEIYNRNGEQIAVVEKKESDSPLDKSWKGTQSDGRLVPENMYLYRVKIYFTNGRTETLTGSVAVIYN